MNEVAATSDFRAAFRGRFSGVLRWEQLDALWGLLRARASDDWYLYAVGEEPPQSTTAGDQLLNFITEVDELLRREHKEDYCGIVYADSLQDPSFIKIFDPNNLGVSCGYSDNPPLPGWILSKLRPVDLKPASALPNNRRRWWQRVFNG